MKAMWLGVIGWGLLLAGTVNAGNIPTNGLVAFYPFDGDGLDASGNGRHAQVFQATLTTDRFGRASCAYYFNGENAYIETPVENSFTALTMSVWVRMKSYPTIRKVIMGAGWTFYDNYLGINNWDPDNKFEAWGGGCGWNCLHELTAPSVCNLEQWYHLAYVHTGTRLNFYINGLLIDSVEAPIQRDSRHIRIGNSSCNDPADGACREFVHADLDDACIYDRALTSSEVAALFEYRPAMESLAVVGFSDRENGAQDVTDFTAGETLYITIKDADISVGSRVARVMVQCSQGRVGRSINLTRDVEQNSFKGSLSLSAFKHGTVNVTIMGLDQGAQLIRSSRIRIY